MQLGGKDALTGKTILFLVTEDWYFCSHRLPIARAAPDRWPGVLAVLQAAGFEVWAMTPASTAEDLWAVEIPERVAVLLGAEGPGLTSAARAIADRRVRIPISPTVDSLNVGQAAAVTFAALTR